MHDYFLLSLKWYFDFGLYGLGFWYAKRTITIQKELRIKETQNLELTNRILRDDAEKLQLELNHYRAQINQHFLYNTLSFIYTKVNRTDTKAAETVDLLGSIMRYSVEAPGPDGMVPLARELEHLDAYIQLHRFRYNEKLALDFKKDIDDGAYRLPPHVLITLVENAFKHGLVTEPAYPVSMTLSCRQGHLHFWVKNRISEAVIHNSTGVGQANLQERLGRAFGDQQRLFCRQDEGYYIAELDVYYKTTAQASADTQHNSL